MPFPAIAHRSRPARESGRNTSGRPRPAASRSGPARPVRQAPEFTGNLSLVYRHESGFMAQAGARYASKIYWAADNDHSRGDVTTVNAKTGYEGESFDIYLYGNNIFGERYMTAYVASMNMALIAPPRSSGCR